MTTNINTGLCHWRTQQGRPPYFVNWQENGEQKYRFFHLRFACEDFKNRLIAAQNVNSDERQNAVMNGSPITRPAH